MNSNPNRKIFHEVRKDFANLLDSGLGSGIFSKINNMAGESVTSAVASYFNRNILHTDNPIAARVIPWEKGFNLDNTSYGEVIPLVFGRAKVRGKVIWATRVQVKKVKQKVTTFDAEQNSHEQIKITYKYSISMAICLCQGEINDIERVWVGDKLHDISPYNYRLYKGTQTQEKDPMIAKIAGDQKTTAYRGLAYIVFENLPLEDFNDTIPVFTFEVSRRGNLPAGKILEEKLNAINIMPGCSEYAYDTKVCEKTFYIDDPDDNTPFLTRYVNKNNRLNQVDSLYNLNQLESYCPNLKWISPCVSWFATDLDIAVSEIVPKAEFGQVHSPRFSTPWQVENYTRSNARIVNKMPKINGPLYYGTPNDKGLVSYLRELKNRNYKVMLRPILSVDQAERPPAHKISGRAEHVINFFRKKNGYNDFILHYAKLCKDEIDAFLIGSELFGLTNIKGDQYTFPAVTELKRLAKLVRAILGPEVKISYAANFVEYHHHLQEDYFNMDELWASEDIDFIGIDNFFPMTNSDSSHISRQDILRGFKQGHYINYSLDEDNEDGTLNKLSLEPPYQYGNIEDWWNNKHLNSDGTYSQWQPRSKPIWFTKFGLNSVDKSTNQPNALIGKKDSTLPEFSTGSVDFDIQRLAMECFIEYWQEKPYVKQMFAWYWDVRPAPALGLGKIWIDDRNWQYKHVLNHKFGGSSVNSVINELATSCGIDPSKLNFGTSDDQFCGLVIRNNQSAIDIINTLRAAYMFDIMSYNNDGSLSFKRRRDSKQTDLHYHEFARINNESFTKIKEVNIDSSLRQVNVGYIYIEQEYNNTSVCYGDGLSNMRTLNLPIAMCENEAEKIARRIVENAQAEYMEIRVKLPTILHFLKPGDVTRINFKGKTILVRINSILSDEVITELTCVTENLKIY